MEQFRSTSGIIIEYDEKETEIILKSISELKKEIKRKHSFFTGLGISFPLHNLANLVKIHRYEDENLLRQLVFMGFVSNPNISETKVEDFLEILGKEIKKFNSRKTQEFHILYPINISSGIFSIDTEITINKIAFKVFSWKYMSEKYQIEALLKKIDKEVKPAFKLDYLKSMTTPFLAHVFDKRFESAFRRVESSAEILRSILNFYESDNVSIQFGIPQPLAKIRKVGHYGIFSPEGKLIAPYFNQSTQSLRENKDLKKISINEILSFIKNLQGNKPNINGILNSSIKLYNSALDTTDNSNAFLSLWQCLESITMLSSERYPMSEVVGRIQCLLNNKKLSYKYFLDLSAQRRNELVHRGIFNVEGQSEVQLLKIVCNFCIRSFIKKIKKYKTYDEMESFYKIAKLDQNKRILFKEIIDTLV